MPKKKAIEGTVTVVIDAETADAQDAIYEALSASIPDGVGASWAYVDYGDDSAEAEADEAEAEDEEEEEEGEEEEDLDALGAAADESDADAVARLEELAEEAEIDPNDFGTWVEVAAALAESQDEAEEDEEEEEDEDESDEFWTEKELKSKGITELRGIARDYQISTKGKNEAALVKAILSA